VELLEDKSRIVRIPYELVRFPASRPLDCADEQCPKVAVRSIALISVSEGGVEVTATVVVLVPGDRVVSGALAHGKLTRVVGSFIHRGEYMDVPIKPRIGSEAIPLVDMFPFKG